MRSEKLAGLGSLVAGVAHELNTPIGNAVIVASTLADQQRRFSNEMAAGLKRSSLTRFVGEVHEGIEVMERNLRRAAELISGFKQVAVDQSSHQRRQFELREIVHELSLTLSPTLRRAGVTLTPDLPAGVTLDSYPGPLSQVIMNVINNAVVHAFAQQPEPRITVHGQVNAGQLTLTLADNGCGIPPEHLSRVFDPFFTTRLGPRWIGAGHAHRLLSGDGAARRLGAPRQHGGTGHHRDAADPAASPATRCTRRRCPWRDQAPPSSAVDHTDDELVPFVEDDAHEPSSTATMPPWQVLIVDDDADVHRATEMALRDLSIEGRPLHLLHAYSRQEAMDQVAQHDDLAVILLDVGDGVGRRRAQARA